MPLDRLREILIHDVLAEPYQPSIPQRRPYTPPASTPIGSLDELLKLRHHFARALPHIARLAQRRDQIGYFAAWAGQPFGDQVADDLDALVALIRELHAPLLDQESNQ